jgi:5-methylcytosine-specific restriction protein A
VISRLVVDTPPEDLVASVHRRSESSRIYVIRRARNTCEGCGRPAPFLTPNGSPYLEVHSLRRLSDGGFDHPRWLAALCPNCHRQAHFGNETGTMNQRLAASIRLKEDDPGVRGSRRGKSIDSAADALSPHSSGNIKNIAGS